MSATNIKVKKWATYKGRRVWLSTQDRQYYYASFGVDTEDGVATDWMIDMRNVGKGEYHGRIPVDDPDLKCDQ